MNAAVWISLSYLIIIIVWIGGSGWLSRPPFPNAVSRIEIILGLAFAFVTAELLYILIRRELKKRDAIEKTLRDLSIRDPLTSLMNRHCFIENFEKAIAQASRTNTKVGVAFIDLDGFKAVNDTHGHEVGDHLLAEIGKRIGGIVRTADSAGRFGGDEFVVLVHGEHDDGTRRLAERLVEALKEPFSVKGHDIIVSASIGFAVFPDHGKRANHLLRAADMAMYRVKKTGKDGIKEASPDP